jgi:hypothetical protein
MSILNCNVNRITAIARSRGRQEWHFDSSSRYRRTDFVLFVQASPIDTGLMDSSLFGINRWCDQLERSRSGRLGDVRVASQLDPFASSTPPVWRICLRKNAITIRGLSPCLRGPESSQGDRMTHLLGEHVHLCVLVVCRNSRCRWYAAGAHRRTCVYYRCGATRKIPTKTPTNLFCNLRRDNYFLGACSGWKAWCRRTGIGVFGRNALEIFRDRA